MGAVNNTIQLNDRMTPVLRSIMKALNATLVAMASVDRVAQREFGAAQRAVQQANDSLITFTNTLRNASNPGGGVNNLNNSLQQSSSTMDTLISQAKTLVATYMGFQGISKLVQAGDAYIGSTAQLDLMLKMNESEKTSAQLQTQIYEASQRSLGNYREMSKQVGKLGLLASKAFDGNTDEMIAFTELLNKQFSLSGATPWEKSAASYQLTQAMASGRLQGDEFRSIIENAPMLAQTIQEFMGLSGEAFKKASKDGQITADVIKNALFSVAKETNEMFNKMPLRFSELWTQIINKIDRGLEPVYRKLRDIWNSKDFQTFLDTTVNGLVGLSNVALKALEAISWIGARLYEYWEFVVPVVLTAAGAFAWYLATVAGGYAMAIGMGIKNVAVNWAQTASTIAATYAQHGLNAALAACPLTWIVYGIMAIVAVVYLAIAAINKFAGTSISATGVIVGAITTAVAFIWNLLIGIGEFIWGLLQLNINRFAMFGNFLANVFQNPVSSIINLFKDMGMQILNIIGAIANAIDAVFGSNLGDSVTGWKSGLNRMATSAVEKYASDENYEKKFGTFDKSLQEMGLATRLNYGTSYKTGYDWGKAGMDSIKDVFRVGDKMFNVDQAFNNLDFKNMEELAKEGNKNTKKLADKGINLNDEDIELLKQYARISFVNRFTTMTPQVTATFGDVHETADVNGIIDQIKKSVQDALESSLI